MTSGTYWNAFEVSAAVTVSRASAACAGSNKIIVSKNDTGLIMKSYLR
jgi:hypothetical protein